MSIPNFDVASRNNRRLALPEFKTDEIIDRSSINSKQLTAKSSRSGLNATSSNFQTNQSSSFSL